jgi:hypothetical protein
MGINHNFFRATGWDYIHSIGHNYAEKPEAMSMIKGKVHFSTLPYMLPHPALTAAMLDFMKSYPVDNVLDDRNNLVMWLFLLNQHLNPVYRSLQPGENLPPDRSYSETCAFYETFRAGCGLSAGKKGPSCRLPVSSTVRTANLKKLLQAQT